MALVAYCCHVWNGNCSKPNSCSYKLLPTSAGYLRSCTGNEMRGAHWHEARVGVSLLRVWAYLLCTGTLRTWARPQHMCHGRLPCSGWSSRQVAPRGQQKPRSSQLVKQLYQAWDTYVGFQPPVHKTLAWHCML